MAFDVESSALASSDGQRSRLIAADLSSVASCRMFAVAYKFQMVNKQTGLTQLNPILAPEPPTLREIGFGIPNVEGYRGRLRQF
ncbi:MAG: hypothetical protein AAFO87_00170 [Cyanobacteria bacterium J06607_6]